MKDINNTRIKSFEYVLNKKQSIKVEFEITNINFKNEAKNLKLMSNWRSNYPKNPQISLNADGEFGFFENGVFITNGDIQQIIKRINHLLKES